MPRANFEQARGREEVEEPEPDAAWAGRGAHHGHGHDGDHDGGDGQAPALRAQAEQDEEQQGEEGVEEGLAAERPAGVVHDRWVGEAGEPRLDEHQRGGGGPQAGAFGVGDQQDAHEGPGDDLQRPDAGEAPTVEGSGGVTPAVRPGEDEPAEDEEERDTGRTLDEHAGHDLVGALEIEEPFEVEAEHDQGGGEAQTGQ